MVTNKILLIHVGKMNNKGTQALISSDVSIIKEVINSSSVSVSTNDIDGVKKLGLPIDRVLPVTVDIPLDNADKICKNAGIQRGTIAHIGFTIAFLCLMPIQIVLILLSVIMSKIGIKAVYRNTIIEEIKKSNLIISHSDENFKETASLLPFNPYWTITWWSVLLSRTLDVMVARSFGKPIILFPNSIGPFRTWLGRFLARLSLKSCDYLLVREPVSYDIVDELKIRSSKTLTYDTALLFTSVRQPYTTSFSRPVVGVCAGVYGHILSKKEFETYIQAHVRALDAAIEKHGFFVVFAPHYVSGFSNDDLDVSKKIMEKMHKKNCVQIIETADVADFKLLLNQMDFVISSKMHPAILASTAYVPVLCIAYDQKQTAFFKRLGMTNCVIDVRNISYEQLLCKIDQTWVQKERLSASLALQIPQWQENIKNAIKKVLTQY